MEFDRSRIKELFTKKENRPPTEIVQCSFERATRDIAVTFNTGISLSIHASIAEEGALRGTFSKAKGVTYKEQGSFMLRPDGSFISDEEKWVHYKGHLQEKPPLPPYVNNQPDIFIQNVTSLLDTLDPEKVSVDPNWRWKDDEKPERTKEHISQVTDTMKTWNKKYLETKK